MVEKGGVCLAHSGLCAEVKAVKDDIADNVKPSIAELKTDIKGLTRHVYYAAGAVAVITTILVKVWK